MSELTETKRLLHIVAQLRNPESGCPWDLQQTHTSLAPYVLEEAYELVEAIETGDQDHTLEELGDVLLQVALHSRIAEEHRAFDFDAVAARLADKLVRRHPHVFAEVRYADAAEQAAGWEAIKAQEQSTRPVPAGLLGKVPANLPGLTQALKLQKKAATVGFDWPSAQGVLDKLHEELQEVEQAEHQGDMDELENELGDLLFTVVNLARHLGVEPERALRAANRKFRRRFQAMEAACTREGRDLSQLDSAALEALWQSAKSSG